MQMHAMNQFSNRGFGGPPQPQRQGRRGNRGGGGFRGNSRFDQNNGQRNPSPGGQRPNNEQNRFQQPQSKPQQQPAQQQPAQQQPQQQTPTQQPKPQQTPPQQQAKPQPAPQQQTPQQKQQQPAAPQQQKPAQTTPAKPEIKSQDKVDKPAPEKTPTQPSPQQQNQQNVNGAFGQNLNKGGWQGAGNKPGGNFGQGGQGNKQGGNFGQGGQGNKQGGNFGQGGQGNKQGGNFGQGGQGNRQGSNFGQGGQGNKPGGSFGQGNKQGGNLGQGGQANKQGSIFGPVPNQGGAPNQGGQANQGDQANQGGNFGQGGGPNKQGGNFGGPGNKQGGGNFGQGQGGQNRQFSGPKQGGHGGPRNLHMGKRGPPEPGLREEFMLANKLKELVGPLVDLPTIDQPEVKFNGRSRLYIGNLSNDTTEEEVLAMFNEFGETAELFLNKEKNFGFIKMDYRANAERAKRELDGKMKNNRPLRVRFAPHNSAVRVKNLPPFVSNELLYRSFEIFGKIERAYVKVDERGKTLGEGVVEYARKPSALAAIRNCTEKCFFLTSSLRPVIVENFEEPDEFDGYPEKNLPKKHPEFLRAREIGPRFAEASSFEHEYGTRWKQLHELHRQKEEALKKELAAEEEKLEAQMEYAKYEHETELLREQLRQREQDRERQKRSWEQAERAAEERREAERLQLQRQEDELSKRMRHQDDELRRRQQENTLFVQLQRQEDEFSQRMRHQDDEMRHRQQDNTHFMQNECQMWRQDGPQSQYDGLPAPQGIVGVAQRLNSMLDRQEQGMFDQQQPMDGGFRDQYDMGRSFDDGRTWDRGMDDYPNKRRRF